MVGEVVGGWRNEILWSTLSSFIMTEDRGNEVRVRLRFPDGGAVLDYRTTRPAADRLAVEFGRHGVSVTIDDQLHDRLPALPHAQLWMRSADIGSTGSP
ncbi:conserved hypothetical protein [Nocardia seriolae]|nr:conserved hypothetical protein [Nocardia seriolae]